MKHKIRSYSGTHWPAKTFITMALLILIVSAVLLSFRSENSTSNALVINEDSLVSVKAFMSVYKVLTSPRCMNCHPSGDVPLQGDNSHPHTMNVQRGKDGHGLYAVKCANCHQNENVAGFHMPPGNPKWHLPPTEMKMVFQGRTPHQLAKQILDPEQNGHKNMEQLLEHANDTLVQAGWHPADGLALPPMSYEAFTKAWTAWLTKGAYVPK